MPAKYHNPTAIMGNSVQNVVISKQLAHTTPAICSVQLKPGLCRFSSVPVDIKGEFLPTEVGYDAELQSDPGEDDKQADELPWDGFWQLVQKSFGCANPVSSAVQVAGLRRSRTAKFCKTTLMAAYGREINIQFSGGHSSVLHASCTQNLRHLWHCVVWKEKNILVVFCAQHKLHLCNDHASWYSTPVRWMDYLGKREFLTNRDGNTFVHKMLEKIAFCVYGTFLVSFISAHETWNQHFTRCLNIILLWKASRLVWR